MAGTEGTPGGTPPGSPPAAAAAAAAGTTMGKAIGLFFFKGGVGKTTHTVNISGALASMGYKVLMVDFDPQCNTTQYFNESGSDDTSVDQEAVQAAEAASIAATLANGQLGNAAGALPLIEQDDPTSTLTPQSMEAFVGGMALGDTGNVSAPFNTFYSAHEPWETLITDADGVGIGIKRVNRESFSGGAAGELSIIPGSPALAKYEKALADACANAPSDEGACKGYGLCHRMLDLFRRQYDFIIVDMSPSAGHLNQVMSMACDYLITPCQASLFSAGSMHALFETVLPKWYHHRDKVCEFQSDEISDPRLRPYCLRGNVPILSPILVGNYDVMVPAAFQKKSATFKVNSNASNFIMTIRSWIIGLEAPAQGSGAPRWKRDGMQQMLNSFALQRADMVVCFLMRCEMTLSACEDLGLAVVEMTPDVFKEEYKVIVQKKSKKRKRSAADDGDAELKLTESHFNLFKTELAYCQRRYKNIATWLSAYANR